MNRLTASAMACTAVGSSPQLNTRSLGTRTHKYPLPLRRLTLALRITLACVLHEYPAVMIRSPFLGLHKSVTAN